MSTLNDPGVSGGPTLRNLNEEFQLDPDKSVLVSYNVRATVNILAGQTVANCMLMYRPPGGLAVAVDSFEDGFSGALSLLSFTKSSVGKLSMIVPPAGLIQLVTGGNGTIDFTFGLEQVF